jgi:hypothetical protein
MLLRRWLILLALLGLVAVVAAMWIDPQTLLLGYLVSVVTVSAAPVGAIGVLFFTYLVRGRWTEGLHVPLTAAALTTPVAGLLFLPVLLGMPWIYPWASGHVAEPGSFKAIYLTPWFFGMRTVMYFAVWTTLAVWARQAWADPQRMVVSASVGLIVYALTASLAGVDWLESLSPEFHSSIYGLIFLTFQLLAGFALALTVALWPRPASTFRYGAILLSILLLWAYNHAMQYIIVWSGNIPDEAVWYLHRETGVWGIALWTLVLLQFVIPFFVLLLSRVRDARGPLLAVAGLTLGLRWVEAAVLALPGTQATGGILWLAIPGTMAFCAGLWWMAFGFAYAQVVSSPHDLRSLPDAFDSSGSPMRSEPGH